MEPYYNPYTSPVVAAQPELARAEFIRKTYWHLAGAIGVFAVLETMMQMAGLGRLSVELIGNSKLVWLMVMFGFGGVGMLADRWARSAVSLGSQYAALGVYILAEAIIFLPMIYIAMAISGDVTLLGKAGVVTGALVLGLTAIAMTTRTDFTFMGGALKIIGLLALGAIVLSCFVPITLGFWFSLAMGVFASACILYQTSAIQRHYRTDQYVSASLGLFASVALLFWYILRIFMSRK